MPPRFDGFSAVFALLNRGKKSVVLDLKREDDRARLAPLLERADVLVEQFRPGVMERLGLGYEAVRAINPRLVYCSISGYGQDRAARGRGRPRPQLHRPHRAARAAAGAARPAGGAAGAHRRHRRRHVAGGDQHPAGAAPARRDRAGLPPRHRHGGRDVHLRLVRAGRGAGDGTLSPAPASSGSRAARRAISSIRPATASSSPAPRWSRNSGWRSWAQSGCRWRRPTI